MSPRYGSNTLLGVVFIMSLLYKKQEDLTYSVECKLLDNGKVHLSFSADCGKFGTDEELDEFEYTVKELLSILQKHDAGWFR